MTREQKTALRAYLRIYPDDRLAALLAHAQDGKLSFLSCCCFIGTLTADHALCGDQSESYALPPAHLLKARTLDGGGRIIHGGGPAETAFAELADTDAERRRLVIPLIRAEQRRRERTRAVRSLPAPAVAQEQR